MSSAHPYRKGPRLRPGAGKPASSLQQARLDAGLTQAELGELVGVSGRHIAHLEAGKRSIASSMLARLAKALGQPEAALRVMLNKSARNLPLFPAGGGA